LVLLLAVVVCGAITEPEDEVKSATVMMFLRMAEWHRNIPVEAPITVGVLGRPSFVEALSRVLNGKSVEKHPVRVVDLNGTADSTCCHAVYIAAQRPEEIQPALAAKYAAQALTIGESKKFLDSGGAVNLFLLDDRISFEANIDALDRAGVSISSKLLRLGEVRNVKTGRKPR
jgi:hypothetical protein